MGAILSDSTPLIVRRTTEVLGKDDDIGAAGSSVLSNGSNLGKPTLAVQTFFRGQDLRHSDVNARWSSGQKSSLNGNGRVSRAGCHGRPRRQGVEAWTGW